MAFLTEKKFSFISKAPSLTDETFAVVKFRGFEAISNPYEFDIMLVSDNPEIDLSEILKKPARFIIHRENGGEVHYNGMLAEFDQLHEYGGYVFYRALLVPKLWWLTLTHHNQVFLDDSVPGIIGKTLVDSGLATIDFEFITQKAYVPVDYVCQYGETHFNFMSRWAEREGIYYYFEQNENGEKIVFTDTKISHTDLPQGKILYYSPPSGLDTLHRTETIKTFTCRQRRLPTKVFVKDYNYEKPSLGIEGIAEVDPEGIGEVYLYGEHFLTPEEGNRLAAIRAEELLCRKMRFFGESTVPFMIPGYTFSVQDHYRESFNRKYLIEEVTHEGNQTGYLISGIRSALSDIKEDVYYINHFTAIPADVQYRPERKAEKPRIPGMINAKVDAEGSGNFAELDEQGRYKIRLPFDINSDHKSGKASHYIRMMQPYAGDNYGVHFPLHKGTEVQLSFVNGDPDRPIISGAIPNPETVSPVTAVNQTKSIFRDNYGNELIFDSTPGDEHIRLHSPHHNSTLQLGRSIISESESNGFEWKGGNMCELSAGNKFEAHAGNVAEVKAGISGEAFFGLGYEIEAAGKHSILIGYDAGVHIGPEFKYHMGPTIEKTDADKSSIASQDNIVSAKQVLNLVGGAKDLQGSTSVVNINEDKILMTVGNNKNPDSTTGQQIVKNTLIMSPIITTFLMAILAASMADAIEKPDEDEREAGIRDTAIAEGIFIAINIALVTLLSNLGLKDQIKPVSHYDHNKDKADSIFQLHKEDGILMGVWPQLSAAEEAAVAGGGNIPAPKRSSTGAAANLQINKDTLRTKIEMNKDGLIDIYSEETDLEFEQIVINVKGEGNKSRKIIIDGSGIQLTCQDGDTDLGEIQIFQNNGEIRINNQNGTGNISIWGNQDIDLTTNGNVTITGDSFTFNGDNVALAKNLQVKGS